MRKYSRAAWQLLTSKPARKAEAAVIAYIVAELVRRGYIPA